jgi:hypothetical protein
VATNGDLTTSQRTALKSAPGQQLEDRAAASWDRLWDAMVSKHAWPMVLTDSYRPRSVQVEIFLDRYRPQATGSGPYGDVRYYNGRRYVRVKGAAAAIPGTSNHGWGRAVDITDVGGFNSARYRALAQTAGYYGWSNSAGKTIGEYWHWEYTAANDKSASKAPPKTVKVTTADIKAMQRAVHTDDDGVWGAGTDKNALSVREASAWGGRQFPWGVKATQRAVGVAMTAKWDTKSGKAHDETVAEMQRVLGVDDDGIWGKGTETAFQRFRYAARK